MDKRLSVWFFVYTITLAVEIPNERRVRGYSIVKYNGGYSFVQNTVHCLELASK